MPNKTFIFKKVPTGVPVPGEHLVVEERPFDLDEPPPTGGCVLEILYASFDPYQRNRMRDSSIKSYSPPLEPGSPVSNDCVAQVLKSDNPDFKEGDFVIAFVPIAQYARLPADTGRMRMLPSLRKIDNPHNLDLALFLGPLGMPGLTAYSSLQEIGKPKKGETIWVSSAAGAVGQLVGQLAKREGLKVVGSVGSDEKLEFITKDLGFDGGFNYKKEKLADALQRLAPEGLDIYYENVGGEHLEAALNAMNSGGRIPMCGAISGYNTPVAERYGVTNLIQIVGKQILMQGFLVGSPGFGPAYHKEHQENVQKWLADGSIVAKIHVTEGIENAAEGFVGMLQGKNFGKAVLKIK